MARFIVGREAPPEFAQRYLTAHQHLFRDPPEGRDAALLNLAIRRPWLLPCIDAALALRRPDALLHRKALLMAAILEASPLFADDFLPRRTGLLGLAWLAARLGAVNLLQLAIGLPIVWWCNRTAGAIAGAAS